MVHVLLTHIHFQSELQTNHTNTTNNNMRDISQKHRESPYDLIKKENIKCQDKHVH
jgi:hypothetical protein